MALLVLLLPLNAGATESLRAQITEIVTAGPSWDTFTNKDGTGLYHEVVREVFGLYDLPVRHEYVRTDRGDQLVLMGHADMMTCDDTAQPPLVIGQYPMYANDYFVFFNKSRIGPWTGAETMKDKEIACQMGYYHAWDFPVPVRLRAMSSGVKCLDMVLLGRSDFYVDDMSFIRDSMKKTSRSFAEEDFDIQKAGTRSYHPLFNQSERGKKIREMYEKGIMTLHKAGKLKPIYDKWGHVYPEFEAY